MDPYRPPRVPHWQSHAVSGLANIPRNLTINDLPDEILLQIIRWVPGYFGVTYPTGTDHQFSLRKLALCSRRLHQLVEPILYEYLYHYELLTTHKCIVSFLTRILERPDLAKRVKVINTRNDYGKDCPSRGPFDMTRVDDDNWTRIRSRISEACYLSTHIRDDWLKGIKLGFWHPIVALLITLTPNLELLELGQWDDGPSRSFSPDFPGRRSLLQIIDQAHMLQVERQSKNPLGLWKLNTIHLGRAQVFEDRFNIDRLFEFVRLPSIKTAGATYVKSSYSTSDKELRDSSILFPNVKGLSLTGTDISPLEFDEYLRRFPNLNRLQYTIGGQTMYARDSLQTVCSVLESISHLKPCLQDLTLLDLGCLGAYKLYQNLVWSMASFPSLRRLDTTWLVLTGGRRETINANGFENMLDIVDVIPSSLEWLRVRYFHRLYTLHLAHTIPVYEQIMLLLAQKHQFPALKQLDLDWKRYRYDDKPWAREPFQCDGFTEEQVLKVLAKCEEVGVEMVIMAVDKNSYYDCR